MRILVYSSTPGVEENFAKSRNMNTYFIEECACCLPHREWKNMEENLEWSRCSGIGCTGDIFLSKKSVFAQKKSERNPGEGKPSDLKSIIGYYYKIVNTPLFWLSTPINSVIEK